MTLKYSSGVLASADSLSHLADGMTPAHGAGAPLVEADHDPVPFPFLASMGKAGAMWGAWGWLLSKDIRAAMLTR